MLCDFFQLDVNVQDLESTEKDTSGKATNHSQHLEQREQQTADVQDTEAASPDNTSLPTITPSQSHPSMSSSSSIAFG